uniref:Uncharacterized protein n=1 Tax=Rhizophagus irregularis (strain DAOM 181602 / DAOM 197198 / MUCL 43194) TaxID=747089 RepID=U9UND3_RHIID
MFRFCHACHIHDKKLVHTPPLPSSPPFTLPCKCISERQNDGFYKTVTFQRLETFYHKSYAFYDHVVHPDFLNSSMWMATKDPAIVIPPTSYNLTMSTTDYSIVQNIRNLVSSRPDVSFCLKERSAPTTSLLRLYPLAS